MPIIPERHTPSGSPAALTNMSTIDEQAAQWWLRRSEGLDADAQAAFSAWLGASPAHAAALKRIGRAWQALDGLPMEQVETMRAIARASTSPAQSPTGDATQTAAGPRPAPATTTGRRAWLRQTATACLTFAAIGGGTWMLVDRLNQPTFTQSYATARGQQLDIQLPDGSTLALDATTQLQVTLYRDRREIRLGAGQALFSVANDAGRPFHVAAGNTRVTVVGTRFVVRHVGADVNVAVEEGRVRVAQATRPEQAGKTLAGFDGILLGAGEAVSADASGTLAPVTRFAAGAIAPWREGRINFDNTTLADALAEFARYGDVRLKVRDPFVASMRVTGSFDIAGFGSFAAALPQVLPVRLSAHGGETEIVRR